jgi:hypothetical protein
MGTDDGQDRDRACDGACDVDPRYFGLFNPTVRRAGVVADALAAGRTG